MRKDNCFLSHVAAALCAVTFLLFTNPAGAQQPRQVLHNHVRPAVASGQAVPVGFLPFSKRLNLAIQLPMRNQEEFDSLRQRLYDPKSPDYRKYLSVAQVTEKFGPTQDDYQTVVDWAKAKGFQVTTTPNRMIVDVNGTVAQIETAFQVVMMVYQHPTEKRTFYSPDREPSLDLGVPVLHISGMDNFSIPRPSVKQRPEDEPAPKPSAGSGPGGLYLAEDMRAAYYGGGSLNGGPAGNGSPTDFGQGVGVLEYGGYDLADVYASFDGISYSVPIFNVLLDGEDGLPTGDDVEQVLDIVQPIGMAPGLNSVHVFIGTVDADILNSMATTNCVGNSKNPQVCQELSVSWCWSPIDTGTLDPIFQTMAIQGQTILIASGDYKAYTGTNACWPAQDQNVVAVGGTDLTTSGPLGSWVSETAWTSTASGYADSGFTIPSWQVGISNAQNNASTTLRNVPDIAAEANFDNWTCHLGACQGGWGGTSFAAPRWAGFLALANQQAAIDGVGFIGFINPNVYSLGQGPDYTFDFHDITSGNNNNGLGQSFNAVTGYDLVTGWGSPTGTDTVLGLVALNTPPTITSANNTTFTVGAFGSFQVTATGYPASMTFSQSGGLPNGVNLSPSGLLSGTPAAGTGGVYNFTITASNGVTPNATQLFTLTVDQAPAFTSGSSATFVVGTLGTFLVTASGFPSPTFSTSGPLPGGVTLSSSGLLSGTPTPGTGGIYVFTIVASNGISPNATQVFTLQVDLAPTITSINHTTFTIGVAGTFHVTATGFPAPTFSEVGALPSGVTLSSSGLLSGIPGPGTSGTYVITITASNGALPNATQIFTLTVVKAPTACSIKSSSSLFTKGVPTVFTASVKTGPAEVDTPTGTVTFQDSDYYDQTLATKPLFEGVSSLTFVLQSPPTRQFVRAVYSGDASFNGCTSPYVTENFE